MSAISETCNLAHNIMELVDIIQNVSFTTNETTYKNGKYKSTDELLNDVRLKKISKLHGIIV